MKVIPAEISTEKLQGTAISAVRFAMRRNIRILSILRH